MHPHPSEGEALRNTIPAGDGGASFLSAREPSTPVIRLAIHEHEMLNRIGRGAYGEVWLARNALGSYRAVKVVYRKDFEDSRPFDREFYGIQKFEPISRSHEGLVHILQVGRREDYFYYIMELADDAAGNPNSEMLNPKAIRNPNAEGILSQSLNRNSDLYTPRTLREELRTHGRLPAERCIEYAIALTTALAHLHKHGLVHRDIKPSNIILVGGKPKLADIGLVTDVGDSQSIVGTEGYLPPEGPGTPKADIFSLGKVLYEISTGQDRREFPDLPRELKDWPDCETVLEINEVVLKACAQDGRHRYASAVATRADLDLLQHGKSVRHERAIQRLWSAGKKAVIAFLLIAAAIAAGPFLWKPSSETYPLSKVPQVNALIVEGNYSVFGNLSEEGVKTAEVCFSNAVKLDPTFLPAHFGLYAASSRRAIIRGQRNPPELRAAAVRLAQLAPGSTEALTASSFVKWFDWDYRGALAEAREATQKHGASKEADCGAHLYYGYFLLENGSPATNALSEFLIAKRLNPINPFVYQHLGNAYAVSRNFSEALKCYEHGREREPRHYIIQLRKARVYEEMGNFDAAIDELEQYDQARGQYDPAKKIFYDELRQAACLGGGPGYWKKRLEIASKASHLDAYYLASLCARLDDKTNAYIWLGRACKEKSFNGGLFTDFCWDRNDEQFKAIAKGIGLLQ